MKSPPQSIFQRFGSIPFGCISTLCFFFVLDIPWILMLPTKNRRWPLATSAMLSRLLDYYELTITIPLHLTPDRSSLVLILSHILFQIEEMMRSPACLLPPRGLILPFFCSHINGRFEAIMSVPPIIYFLVCESGGFFAKEPRYIFSPPSSICRLIYQPPSLCNKLIKTNWLIPNKSSVIEKYWNLWTINWKGLSQS